MTSNCNLLLLCACHCLPCCTPRCGCHITGVTSHTIPLPLLALLMCFPCCCLPTSQASDGHSGSSTLQGVAAAGSHDCQHQPAPGQREEGQQVPTTAPAALALLHLGRRQQQQLAGMTYVRLTSQRQVTTGTTSLVLFSHTVAASRVCNLCACCSWKVGKPVQQSPGASHSQS